MIKDIIGGLLLLYCLWFMYRQLKHNHQQEKAMEEDREYLRRRFLNDK